MSLVVINHVKILFSLFFKGQKTKVIGNGLSSINYLLVDPKDVSLRFPGYTEYCWLTEKISWIMCILHPTLSKFACHHLPSSHAYPIGIYFLYPHIFYVIAWFLSVSNFIVLSEVLCFPINKIITKAENPAEFAKRQIFRLFVQLFWFSRRICVFFLFRKNDLNLKMTIKMKQKETTIFFLFLLFQHSFRFCVCH